MSVRNKLSLTLSLAGLTVSTFLCASTSAEDTSTASTPSAMKALDPASIEKGKQNYAMFCQACHGPEDAGIDSPSNLFDAKWYHGEGRQGIGDSIRNGIAEKGMPAWGQMIPEEDINSVIDYLLSFQKPEHS